jgi:polysaccharide export outer membrane protein
MQKTLSSITFAIIFLFSLPHLSHSQSQILENPPASKSAPGGIYIIGSGDVLEIVTWKEPDFSRDEIVVRLDGHISFPLLDDIVAAGRTPTQLKYNIQNRLGPTSP